MGPEIKTRGGHLHGCQQIVLKPQIANLKSSRSMPLDASNSVSRDIAMASSACLSDLIHVHVFLKLDPARPVNYSMRCHVPDESNCPITGVASKRGIELHLVASFLRYGPGSSSSDCWRALWELVAQSEGYEWTTAIQWCSRLCWTETWHNWHCRARWIFFAVASR